MSMRFKSFGGARLKRASARSPVNFPRFTGLFVCGPELGFFPSGAGSIRAFSAVVGANESANASANDSDEDMELHIDSVPHNRTKAMGIIE